jgi:hypothetical protein
MNEAPPIAKRVLKNLFGLFVFWAVVVVGLLAVFLGGLFLEAAMTVHHADEGFKRARRTINPEELRRWAFQEINKHGGAKNSDIPRSEIPDYIQRLYSERPEVATAVKAPGQPSRVVIFWGGGFFHWVIDIGETNYSKPYVIENSDYCNFEWTNGIYYSREADWKLR